MRSPRPAKAPDAEPMRRALRDFLEAAGLDLADPDLRETPARVVEAWIGEILDGYRTTPAEALGETYPAPEGSGADLVVVSGLRFHSMCPHHLLPVHGIAHVAYVPGERIVGFGRMGALVDCFAHRLILQEEIARQVARALVSVLGSPGAACVLDAEHGCMRIKGGRHVSARAHCEAYEGVLRTDRDLRRTLWSRLA